MKHYHIRWANSNLDWEAFPTEVEANARAEQLKQPGESYAIEQANAHCQRCENLKPPRLRAGTPAFDSKKIAGEP
jgi:hypothetical protein